MKLLSSFILAACAALAGCAGLPTSGPHADAVKEAASAPPRGTQPQIRVLDVSPELVQRIDEQQRRATLAEAFGTRGASVPRFVIGYGDSIEVSVWEAPPAALFGVASPDSRVINSSSRVAALPEQMVNSSGEVNVPFAGAVKVVGRTAQEVEEEISARLKTKAHDPQVLVRILRNASNTVTVVGEVANSVRFPLTPSGERLLDALAAAGGFKQAVGKLSIRLTRDVVVDGKPQTRVVSLPLETIITDPAQNIKLQAGDVVTALFQSNSFIALGATGRNEEIAFEAQGISAAQALGRSGGLRDERANAAGVFIFRFEDASVFDQSGDADGKVPVVYRFDLKDPASFFLAQEFPMRNRDVLYIANAPAAELQKFLNMVSSVIFPLATTRSVTN
jgi:polysaccharide export outer membrane protein